MNLSDLRKLAESAAAHEVTLVSNETIVANEIFSKIMADRKTVLLMLDVIEAAERVIDRCEVSGGFKAHRAMIDTHEALRNHLEGA